MRRALLLSLGLTACVSRLIVGLDGTADDGNSGTSDEDDDAPRPDDDDDDDSVTDAHTPADVPSDCDIDSHESDCDGDGIPDGDDPTPDDPSGPGPARSDVVYLHSGSTLYTFSFETLESETVGDFVVPDMPGAQILDIAIDRFGLLYAINFSGVFICDPNTVVCTQLASVASNSLGFVPAGIIDPVDDVLVAVADTTVTHILLRGPEATVVEVGEVTPYSSSGDLEVLVDGRTVFTSPGNDGNDVLVEIDPITGTPLSELGPAFSSTWGLAKTSGLLLGFTQDGNVYTFDQGTPDPTTLSSVPVSVYGAASHPDAG